ncbi:MAG: hypothetical protein A2289_08080 [Deltaproteobacteria bacterium RIFOXYA12_FULL_58_15]|nr:MAG: hypothetical protein A2289_08080 [Deltaproteobacteria bacterium RIFOXYA12_FULL_58_15]OGR09489.1 MAG: hypothetical protein A2341_01685 [Deltaproteobacteria bacterium RIFOXYB12_FULL_58_9]
MASNVALSHETAGSWDGCLVGTLETWALSDIITWLHQTHRCAMLRVGVGFGAGVIFFKHGQLYRCEWGALSGETALISLLGLSGGAFSLIQRDPPHALTNVFRPTAELLLQLAIAQDERVRHG